MANPETLTVVRGGIVAVRDVRGNLRICARGDGCIDVQSADVMDLLAAVTEILRSDPEGGASPARREVTGRFQVVSDDEGEDGS